MNTLQNGIILGIANLQIISNVFISYVITVIWNNMRLNEIVNVLLKYAKYYKYCPHRRIPFYSKRIDSTYM